MSDKSFPKLGLPKSAPTRSFDLAKQRPPVVRAAPKEPSELVSANEQPYALGVHKIAMEEMRPGRDAAAVLEAMMVRITGDDALFRRIAIPMLRKQCNRSIKRVKKQIAFQEAVAKAVAQQKGGRSH
jgi:hypothetical protein